MLFQFSTKSKQTKLMKKEKDEDHVKKDKQPWNPQEEYAATWDLTTDDKIEQLTEQLRKGSWGKKMHYLEHYQDIYVVKWVGINLNF